MPAKRERHNNKIVHHSWMIAVWRSVCRLKTPNSLTVPCPRISVHMRWQLTVDFRYNRSLSRWGWLEQFLTGRRIRSEDDVGSKARDIYRLLTQRLIACVSLYCLFVCWVLICCCCCWGLVLCPTFNLRNYWNRWFSNNNIYPHIFVPFDLIELNPRHHTQWAPQTERDHQV